MSTWTDVEDKVSRLVGKLPALTKGVGAAADLVSARRAYTMAGPAAVADRLKALKASIEAESEKLIADIDRVEKQDVPAAFAKGRTLLTSMGQDVASLEAELAQLTNLPLGS